MTHRSRSPFAAGLAWFALCGCAGAAHAPQAPPPPQDFAGVRYPSPEPPPPGAPQPAPSLLPPDDDGPIIADKPGVLDNAALRDLEIERLLRAYFALVESLYRVTAGRQPPMTQRPEQYDSLPLWRMEAQSVPELAQLEQRAAAVQAALLDFAQRRNIDLLGAQDGKDRAARVRLLFRISTCVRRDAQERAAQGMALVQAMQSGTGERAFLDAQPAPMRYLADMTLLARTMECSKLASRALPGPP